jgi:hypothetical protein
MVSDQRRKKEESEHTFGVLNNLWVVSFHDGDAGIGCSEINSNDAIHESGLENDLREVSLL